MNTESNILAAHDQDSTTICRINIKNEQLSPLYRICSRMEENLPIWQTNVLDFSKSITRNGAMVM